MALVGMAKPCKLGTAPIPERSDHHPPPWFFCPSTRQWDGSPQGSGAGWGLRAPSGSCKAVDP